MMRPDTDFPFNSVLWGFPGTIICEPLILRYQRSFFQQVWALREPFYTNDLTWKGKAEVYDAPDKLWRGWGRKIFKWESRQTNKISDEVFQEAGGFVSGFGTPGPFLVVYCKDKQSSEISPHWQNFTSMCSSHSAVLLPQIVIRLMRQVYFYVNISSENRSSHQHFSSLEKQPTNHFALIFLQSLWNHADCTWMQKHNNKKSSHHLFFFHTATKKKTTTRSFLNAAVQKTEISLPSHLFHSTHSENKSAGSVTGVDQYPLTLLHCHAWTPGSAEICTGGVQ